MKLSFANRISIANSRDIMSVTGPLSMDPDDSEAAFAALYMRTQGMNDAMMGFLDVACYWAHEEAE